MYGSFDFMVPEMYCLINCSHREPLNTLRFEMARYDHTAVSICSSFHHTNHVCEIMTLNVYFISNWFGYQEHLNKSLRSKNII